MGQFDKLISDEERFAVENERSAMDSDDDEDDLKKPRSSTAPSGSSNSTQTQEDFIINYNAPNSYPNTNNGNPFEGN